jgi:hypothetical protein
MGSVLLISPHFPPSNLAGVHRVRHLAKWLPKHGWRTVVLCVQERFYEERLDQELARLIPGDIEVVKINAFSAWMTKLVGVGDLSLRSYVQMRIALASVIGRFRPNVVLITGGPYFSMLLSRAIRKHFGLPVLIDFQDPWVSGWGAVQHRWSKIGIMHMLALHLEPVVMRNATYVTSVSERQNDDLAARYPWFDRSCMAAIPIGGDPEDFSAISNVNNVKRFTESNKLVLNFVGTYWPKIDQPLTCFLNGLCTFKKLYPKNAERLRVRFIGTDASSRSLSEPKIIRMAEKIGIADMVEELPARLPFLESIRVLMNSDVILMIGSDEPHYTASKIYPSLMSGRPFLSLFHRESSAHDILNRAGGGITLAFTTPEELIALVPQVVEALRRISHSIDSLGSVDSKTYMPYTAQAIAKRYADILTRISVA